MEKIQRIILTFHWRINNLRISKERKKYKDYLKKLWKEVIDLKIKYKLKDIRVENHIKKDNKETF